jgi:hypothetical protein
MNGTLDVAASNDTNCGAESTVLDGAIQTPCACATEAVAASAIDTRVYMCFIAMFLKDVYLEIRVSDPQ